MIYFDSNLMIHWKYLLLTILKEELMHDFLYQILVVMST